MKKIKLHEKYVLNPAYKFRSDILNVVVTNNNPGRYRFDPLRTDITTSFAWNFHPDLASIFGQFDGSRTMEEITAQFCDTYETERHTFLETVSPCICNECVIQIPTPFRNWISVPKNFLIPNPEGIVRENLLGKVDLAFIRQNYNLSNRRLLIPNSMSLMLTTSCATDCLYCYADRPPIWRPLPFARIQEILNEADDLDMAGVDVDGGEFFLYNHWRELIKEMRKHDYLPSISTKHPLSKEMVQDLKDLGIKYIQLSIDSVISQELQQMWHVDEQYVANTLHGLQLLNEAGFNITVKPVITRFNDSEKSLNAFLDKIALLENVREVNFTPAEFSRFKAPLFFSNNAQLARLKTIVEERNKDCAADLHFLEHSRCLPAEQREKEFPQRPLCTGNVHGFFVLPDGKVTLCERMYWHPFFIFGDLNDQSIMEAWRSKEAFSIWNFSQEEIRDDSPCKTCEDFQSCRRGLGNCWRAAIDAYGPENYDFPAPDCPKAPEVTKSYYIP